MVKQVDNCEDDDIEKGQPLLRDKNYTTKKVTPNNGNKFVEDFIRDAIYGWPLVSLDGDAPKNRNKDYIATCAHSPIKVLDILFILPLLFRQLWNIYRMEIALRLVAKVEQMRKDGWRKDPNSSLRATCEYLYTRKSDETIALWVVIASFWASIHLYLWHDIVAEDLKGQNKLVGFISLAVFVNFLCIVSVLARRDGFLFLPIVSMCAAGLFRAALVAEAFVWIHPYIDGLLSFSYATVGMGLSEVFVNWDILTSRSALGGLCGGTFACSSVFLNFILFVPLPLLPSLLFGFSFGLLSSWLWHLKSSMILGEPSATHIYWVKFFTMAFPSVAFGIMLYSAAALILTYCDGMCFFNTAVHGKELIAATMKEQVSSYKELLP